MSDIFTNKAGCGGQLQERRRIDRKFADHDNVIENLVMFAQETNTKFADYDNVLENLEIFAQETNTKFTEQGGVIENLVMFAQETKTRNEERDAEISEVRESVDSEETKRGFLEFLLNDMESNDSKYYLLGRAIGKNKAVSNEIGVALVSDYDFGYDIGGNSGLVRRLESGLAFNKEFQSLLASGGLLDKMASGLASNYDFCYSVGRHSGVKQALISGLGANEEFLSIVFGSSSYLTGLSSGINVGENIASNPYMLHKLESGLAFRSGFGAYLAGNSYFYEELAVRSGFIDSLFSNKYFIQKLQTAL